MYNVFGWNENCDYDANKPANFMVTVFANNLSDAEDKGDVKIGQQYGKCSVIVGEFVRADM